MPLRLVKYSDPRLFLTAVLDHLLQSEAEYCAHIGLVQRLANTAYTPSLDEMARPLLWTVQNDDQIDLIAIQTLKTKMLVSRGSDAAMRFLADDLISHRWPGNGIIGSSPSINAFVDHFTKSTGHSAQIAIRLRAFQLNSVIWPKPAAGAMQLCTPPDRNWLAVFLKAFESEIREQSDEPGLARADRLIAERRIFLWHDQHPVAIAAWAGQTPNGVRINNVYTPPEFRGRGYASNLVARLTQSKLDEGRRFCFLFTDQANPTSNSIYQKIGYQAVADSERWEFST